MATAHFSMQEPHLPSAREIELAKESSRALVAVNGGHEALQLNISGQNITITLPQAAVRLLVDILTNMSEGNAVTLIPIHAELTTQQAADLLNVSRKFLIDELLETHVIPCRKVGTHRRIQFMDLMRYKQETEAKRRDALTALSTHDQELGLY